MALNPLCNRTIETERLMAGIIMGWYFNALLTYDETKAMLAAIGITGELHDYSKAEI